MRKFLSKADMFGVGITQNFDTDLPTYKSAIGGISTIIIYSLSLAYAIYMFSLRFDGQLQPSASMTNYVTHFSKLDQTNSLIQISYWRYDNNLIDPFKSQGNILTPILYITTQNNEFVSQQVLLNNQTTALNEFNSTLIDSQLKMEFTYDSSINMQNIKHDYYLLIAKCEDRLMSNGSYCANQSQMNAFFAQPGNTVLFDYQFQTLDFFTREQSIVRQRLSLQIETTVCYQQTSYLKSTYYSLQDDLLFGSPYDIELMDAQRIQSQSNSIQFCEEQYNNYTTYITGYMQYRNLQTLNAVKFPNLGDILANIGSIAGCIFLLKHLVLFLNDYFLTDLIVKQMMQFYYPELQDVKVEYSWRHQPLLVKFKGRDINLEYYKNFKQRAYEMMTQKLTYKNVIYELSRMQFVLRSMQSRSLLRQSHNVGIKLNFREFKHATAENVMTLQRSKTINPLILTEEDCELFSYRASMKYRDIGNQDSDQNDFYEINNLRQLGENSENRSPHILPVPSS